MGDCKSWRKGHTYRSLFIPTPSGNGTHNQNTVKVARHQPEDSCSGSEYQSIPILVPKETSPRLAQAHDGCGAWLGTDELFQCSTTKTLFQTALDLFQGQAVRPVRFCGGYLSPSNGFLHPRDLQWLAKGVWPSQLINFGIKSPHSYIVSPASYPVAWCEAQTVIGPESFNLDWHVRNHPPDT